MTEVLRIEPIPSDHEVDAVVLLDPHFLEHRDFEPDDFVEIQAGNGRRAVSRLGQPLDADYDSGSVRLPSEIRQTLKVSIGDTVEVKEADIEKLKSVTFAPLSDISGLGREDLAAYLRELFLKKGSPVNVDTIEYIRFPSSKASTGFKVLEADPARGVIHEDTTVQIDFSFPTWGIEEETTYDDIGGLNRELETLRELIEFPIRFPDVYLKVGINPARGILLHGPPGTGKTLTTRAISNELDADFHYINGPGIIATGYGETESRLREVFQEAKQALPAVVFIDEIDAIAPRRKDTGSISDLRVVSQLLELMDGLEKAEGVMVIATTNRRNAIEPALRRPGRFDREVYIGPPDAEGREEILNIHTRGMLLDEDVASSMKELASKTHGYTGADLMELTREAGINALRRRVAGDWQEQWRSDLSVSDIVVRKDDFERALDTVPPSVVRSTISRSSDVTFEQIGGLEEEKQRMRDLLQAPHAHPDVFQEMGINPPSGILITGPSGTGKTLLARAAGNEFGTTFFELDASEVFSQWLGESEEHVKEVFQSARRAAPSIILIDNLEVIAGTRKEESGATLRVANQLVTEIDATTDIDSVTVIGTTVDIDSIDDMFLSSHRFSEHVRLAYPDAHERMDIIDIYLSDVTTDFDQADVESIVDQTDGWSGADIEALCRATKLHALREVEFRESTPVGATHLRSAFDELESKAESGVSTKDGGS